LIGVIAAIVAHRKKCKACWPALETAIVISIYLIIGAISQNIVSPTMEVMGIAGASCFMGGRNSDGSNKPGGVCTSA
jgi:hypothetical protein